jgi:hypothetical protein
VIPSPILLGAASAASIEVSSVGKSTHRDENHHYDATIEESKK